VITSDKEMDTESSDLKREAHIYLLDNGYKENQLLRVNLIKQFKEKEKKEGRFELQQLEQLERLQQLERLEQLKRTSNTHVGKRLLQRGHNLKTRI
jgi:hypothetical protein